MLAEEIRMVLLKLTHCCFKKNLIKLMLEVVFQKRL